MANVLRANSTAAADDALVAKDVPAYHADVYAEIETGWPAASMAAWVTDGLIPFFIALDENNGADPFSGPRQLLNFGNLVNVNFTNPFTSDIGWFVNDSSPPPPDATDIADDVYHVVQIRLHEVTTQPPLLNVNIDGTPLATDADQIWPAENWPSNNAGVNRAFGDAAARTKIAGQFQVDIAADLLHFWLPLQKNGTPTDNVIVEIQTDAAGQPSGTVLYSTSIPGTSLPDTIGIHVPAGVPLATGTTYWIVLSRSGALDASKYYISQGPASSNGEAFNGTTWGAPGTSDVGENGIWVRAPIRLGFGSFFADGTDAPLYYRHITIGTGGFGSNNLFDEDWATGDTAITADFDWHEGTIPAELHVLADPLSATGCLLSLDDPIITVTQSTTGTAHVTSTLRGGPDSNVTLAAIGQPVGMTVAFAPNPIDENGGVSTISVTPDLTVAPSVYTVHINGTDGNGNTCTTTLTVDVVLFVPLSVNVKERVPFN
jgi:hypothetical protein